MPSAERHVINVVKMVAILSLRTKRRPPHKNDDRILNKDVLLLLLL